MVIGQTLCVGCTTRTVTIPCPRLLRSALPEDLFRILPPPGGPRQREVTSLNFVLGFIIPRGAKLRLAFRRADRLLVRGNSIIMFSTERNRDI